MERKKKSGSRDPSEEESSSLMLQAIKKAGKDRLGIPETRDNDKATSDRPNRAGAPTNICRGSS